VRVTALELFPVPPRWLFLKVSTDEGVVAVAPHCSLAPIALAASLELDACTPTGVEIDDRRVRAAAAAPAWRNPIWRNADGTVAEW
jgi:hypothetical protein